MSSAVCFILEKSKILSSGNGLNPISEGQRKQHLRNFDHNTWVFFAVQWECFIEVHMPHSAFSNNKKHARIFLENDFVARWFIIDPDSCKPDTGIRRLTFNERFVKGSITVPGSNFGWL